MSGRDAFVGVDLGTSSVKVLACRIDGTAVAQSARSYPLETPGPLACEQDARTIVRATHDALGEVLGAIRAEGDRAAAIAFSSAMHGVVPVDAAGEPIAPLLPWLDRRAIGIARTARDDGTGYALYRATGAPMHPMLPACKLRWYAEHDRATFGRASRFVSIKDLVVHSLTGAWLADPGMLSGTGYFDLRERSWNGAGLAFARVDADRLPGIAHCRTVVDGRLETARRLGIDARTAIVLGSSDGALANLGLGAVAPGRRALTLGTSGALRAVTNTIVLDDAMRIFCYAFEDTRYIAGGSTNAGGAAIDALLALVFPDVAVRERTAHALELAVRTDGSNGVVVLPSLAGERAPSWDASATGGILGLRLDDSRATIARALFESIVFAVADIRDALDRYVGCGSSLRVGGGLTSNRLIRELVADVFERPAVRTSQDETSAYGAALFGAIVTGAFTSVDEAVATVTVRDTIEPDAGRAKSLERAYARYRSAGTATRDLRVFDIA